MMPWSGAARAVRQRAPALWGVWRTYYRPAVVSHDLRRVVAATAAAKSIPMYQALDRTGRLHDASGTLLGLSEATVNIPRELAIRMIKEMVKISVLDGVMYDAQRQGRISFYMTSTGEEAIHVGSAAALTPADHIYAQYRESGVFTWRGFSLDDIMNQCYGTALDPGKGRQMPIHYGSAACNIQTISSPLGTQLPQAVGAAYALKMAARRTSADGAGGAEGAAVVVCYFGEGAASEGDFHAALNMAATTEAPVVFFWYATALPPCDEAYSLSLSLCARRAAFWAAQRLTRGWSLGGARCSRNNEYAISTTSREQYRGDGIGRVSSRLTAAAYTRGDARLAQPAEGAGTASLPLESTGMT